MLIKKAGFLFLNFSVLFLCLSCATYQDKTREAKSLIRDGRFTQAEMELLPLAEKESDSQLVHLLDLASLYQAKGEYRKSADYFIRADKMSEIVDYTSLSRETGAILLGEEQLQYKGDDFEIVLIHAMNAINFLSLGDLDSSLVEVRRLNEKMNRFKNDAGREYFSKSGFAQLLSGLIWEADRKWDDAYIAFEKAAQTMDMNDFLKADLLRAAAKSGRKEDLHKWQKAFPEVKKDVYLPDKKSGELVILYMQGLIPEKIFHPSSYRYPSMSRILADGQWARLKIQDKEYLSHKVYDAESVAIASLLDQYDKLVARRMGGLVGKAVVADQIRQKNQLLGDLAWIAMNLSDRADLRQWSTLPASFQMIRVWLPEGEYPLELASVGSDQKTLIEEFHQIKTVQVKAGRKSFLSIRSFK